MSTMAPPSVVAPSISDTSLAQNLPPSASQLDLLQPDSDGTTSQLPQESPSFKKSSGAPDDEPANQFVPYDSAKIVRMLDMS